MSVEIERRMFETREDEFRYVAIARGIVPDSPDWIRLREAYFAKTEANKALSDDLNMRLRAAKAGVK